jgi:plasmid stabilization system protein ParE
MSRRLIVRPEAEADADEAYRWYEQRRTGLGEDFFAVVDQALDLIERSPTAFPRVHKDVRRLLTKRFPFAVFYVVTPDAIAILAIRHQASDPERWRSRH